MKRRHLLQLASTLPAGLPVLGAASGSRPGDSIAGYRLPGSGMLVRVDAAANGFRGSGYYLYPDWGTPALYFVQLQNGMLAFQPADRSRVSWQQSLLPSPRFAGQVVDADEIVGYPLPALVVPAQPPA